MDKKKPRSRRPDRDAATLAFRVVQDATGQAPKTPPPKHAKIAPTPPEEDGAE